MRSLWVVWDGRRLIAKAAAVGLAVALVLAFVIRPRFESTVRLMPPERQSMMGLAALLSGGSGDDKGGAGAAGGALLADMLGGKTSGAMLIGVLRSRTLQDHLIDRFNLLDVYELEYRQDARERLEKYTEITEDRKSGIVTVSVLDRSPVRARDMAAEYADELNRLLAQLNMSAGAKERAFLQERLKGAEDELQQATRELSAFSSKHAMLDVKEQARAMVDATATLHGELIAAQSLLSSLQQIYTPQNVRVRALRARIAELKRQIAKIEGSGPPAQAASGSEASKDTASSSVPSIRELPLLGATYYDLYRKAKVREAVLEVLTKQYEMARIQEAREVPAVRILDQAMVPEKKSTPKRTLLVLLGLLVGGVLGTVYVLCNDYWSDLDELHPLKAFAHYAAAGARADHKGVSQALQDRSARIKAWGLKPFPWRRRKAPPATSAESQPEQPGQPQNGQQRPAPEMTAKLDE